MGGERIVLLARDSAATRMLFHALASAYDVRVVLETPPSTRQLLRSRIKRLGLADVIGQVLFQVLVAKPLAWSSRRRSDEILAEHAASIAPIPPERIQFIRSVNDPDSWHLVRGLSPAVVVINGTRILRATTIAAIGVPILNTHVGITPMYRGVHGAYWALVRKDRDHCGVTVHLVDAGVDTGAILHQALIHPTSKDNFSTYPVLQMAVGCRLMTQSVSEVIAGTADPQAPSGPSMRWNHPTLWGYIRERLRNGVR